MINSYTVRVDRTTGRLDERTFRNLLLAIEDYIDGDKVDKDDEAAIVAVNLLIRHFQGEDTTAAEWAKSIF